MRHALRIESATHGRMLLVSDGKAELPEGFMGGEVEPVTLTLEPAEVTITIEGGSEEVAARLKAYFGTAEGQAVIRAALDRQ